MQMFLTGTTSELVPSGVSGYETCNPVEGPYSTIISYDTARELQGLACRVILVK